MLASKSLEYLVSQEIKNNHPAKNLDDDSDGSESQQYRDSYQDETKKNGKNDQSCKDDDAQNSSSEDRPKGCSNLIRRKRYLFGENGHENDCQDKPND